MRYSLAPATIWFTNEEGLAVLSARHAHVFEPEDADVIRAFLEHLRAPRTETELSEEFGEDATAELLSAFTELGVVEARPVVGSAPVADALKRGCAVLAQPKGAGAELAAAVLAQLRGDGIEARRVSRVEDGGDGLVIGCFASLFDSLLLGANARALDGGLGLYLPVIVDDDETLIGPPISEGAPCSRCVALRRFAFKEPELHSAWYFAQKNPVSPDIGLDPHRIPGIASAIAAYLQSLDDELRIDGVEHALMRARDARQDVRRVLRHSHCRACGPRRDAQPDSALPLDEQAAHVRDHWRAIFDAHDPECIRPEPAVERMYQDSVVGLLQHGEDWSQAKRYFRNLPECWGGVLLAREQDWVSTNMQGVNGTGPNLSHMRLVMLSEGLERYAQYSHRPVFENRPWAEVRDHAIDPRELTLYDDQQYADPTFPLQRFREDLPLNWSWGFNAHTGEAKLFPSEVITVHNTDETYPNRIIEQRLTTGGASHVSYARALNNAMRELIERDQLMIAWYKRVALPRIALPERTGDEYVDGLLEFLRGAGVQMDCFDMRLDFRTPSFLVVGTVAERQGMFYPGGTVGAAASDLDPLVALGRALGEMRIHYETLALTPDANKDFSENPSDPHDMTQGWGLWWPNYMWHLNPQNRRSFDFLYDHDLVQALDGIESLETQDPIKNRDGFFDEFRRVGLSPWVWDIGNEETSHSGFRIVKVEVPGICHLVPGRPSRRLACPRFESVPAALGRPSLGPGEQNPDPHVQA